MKTAPLACLVSLIALGAALSTASSASAIPGCHCASLIFSSPTVVGTGSTCLDAQANASGNLFNWMDIDCQTRGYDTVCGTTYTYGTCTQNGSGQKVNASATYKCASCPG